MIMLATSPGPGGAASVLAMAVASAPYFDGEVKASFSVPSFYDNFDVEQGSMKNDGMNRKLITVMNSLLDSTTLELKRAS